MDAIQQFIRRQRQSKLAESSQLTLGELIEKLEACDLEDKGSEDKKEPKQVDFDFASAVPTTLDSWRGSYDELALGFKLSGYDNQEEHFANCPAKELLKELKSAIGKTYEGWKGGYFTMSKETAVWVSNPGNSGNTGIIEVVDEGWRIVLMTSYFEY